MRKIILSTAVFIIFVLIVGPFAAGFWIEKSYRDLISFYNSENIFHIKLLSYERHWFTSDMSYQISIDKKLLQKFLDPEDIKSVPGLLVKQHVQNGLGFLNTLYFSTILVQEKGEKDIEISHLNLNYAIQHDKDFFTADTRIKMDSIQLEDRQIGPIEMEVSIHKLNSPAIHDLLAAYHNYIQNGEVYQGQLRQRISMILPTIVSAGSSVSLDKFNFSASNEVMSMNGVFEWPEMNFIQPSDVHDLIMTGQAQLDMKVSKKLASNLIHLASTNPDFIRDVAEPQRNILIAARDQLDFAEKRNAIFIDYLSDRNYISKKAEDTLIDMQKNMVPMDEYIKTVSDLFLDRQIALVVSYQLGLQYAEIIKPYQFLENSVLEYQKIAEKQIQEIFNAYVKKGYISENHDDYSAMLKWSENAFTSNGIEVKALPE